MRHRYVFDGHVQGVGFRATTCQVARGHAVSGYVRNLPDGRVEVVADGAEPAIQAFLEDLVDALSGHIRNVSSGELPPGEPFDGFRIRF